MPCYHDVPNEDDQVEIQKRCKERMYFDVQSLMNTEQINKSQQIGLSMFPLPDVNTALCKLCSILTKEQMEKISAFYYEIKWEHKTLYDWYQQHCKDDERFNNSQNQKDV